MQEALNVDQLGVCSSHPLWQVGATTFPVKYGRSVIERILPHRPPFLLLDNITHVDLRQGGLRAQRRIDPRDPVFAGHMPGSPVYPAVLLLAMVAQASGCLAYFRSGGVPSLGAPPLPWFESKFVVRRACFPRTVHAGDGLAILVKLLVDEAGGASFAGQVLRNDDLCSAVVIELGDDSAARTGGSAG